MNLEMLSDDHLNEVNGGDLVVGWIYALTIIWNGSRNMYKDTTYTEGA